VACGFPAIFSIKIFLFQIQITSPNNAQTTMGLLEHQPILGRLQRKHRKAQEEAAALRAQAGGRIIKSTPPPTPTQFLFATTEARLRPADLRRLVLHPPRRRRFRWMGLRRRVPA
jgi:hypothetical protein